MRKVLIALGMMLSVAIDVNCFVPQKLAGSITFKNELPVPMVLRIKDTKGIDELTRYITINPGGSAELPDIYKEVHFPLRARLWQKGFENIEGESLVAKYIRLENLNAVWTLKPEGILDITGAEPIQVPEFKELQAGRSDFLVKNYMGEKVVIEVQDVQGREVVDKRFLDKDGTFNFQGERFKYPLTMRVWAANDDYKNNNLAIGTLTIPEKFANAIITLKEHGSQDVMVLFNQSTKQRQDTKFDEAESERIALQTQKYITHTDPDVSNWLSSLVKLKNQTGSNIRVELRGETEKKYFNMRDNEKFYIPSRYGYFLPLKIRAWKIGSNYNDPRAAIAEVTIPASAKGAIEGKKVVKEGTTVIIVPNISQEPVKKGTEYIQMYPEHRRGTGHTPA